MRTLFLFLLFVIVTYCPFISGFGVIYRYNSRYVLCAHPLFVSIKSFYFVGCPVARSPPPGRSGGRRGPDGCTSRTISVSGQNHLCPTRRPLLASLCLAKFSVSPYHTLSLTDQSPCSVASAFLPSLLLSFTVTRHQRALRIPPEQRRMTTPTNS